MRPKEAGRDSAPERWFLTPGERGNPATRIDERRGDGLSWTAGNRVEPLVDGATYFRRLLQVVEALGEGDRLYFTDWRGDHDERLSDGPETSVGACFAAAVSRGVSVKGLLWRSHGDLAGFSTKENRHLGDVVNAAGGEVLLDMRTRFVGSHHQKLVIVRRPGQTDTDTAFAGGIDLCHGRRDDDQHRGDPQPLPMPPVYGATPPWHDVQVEIQGPAVGDLEFTFRERWDDPTPLSSGPLRAVQALQGRMQHPGGGLPPMPPDPAPRGTQAIQVLRTYGRPRHPYPFAPEGERSIARAYVKAVRRARRLIYIEDQFLWSDEVVASFAEALKTYPHLRIIAVVPRHFDQGGVFKWPSQVGREQAMKALLDAGGDRVGIYDVENPEGTPVYVHAKVCVIDDVWAAVGSDNFNRRSWTHDSEVSCAVLDETRDSREPRDPAGLGDSARFFARDLRLRLWREHLDRGDGDDADLVEPEHAVQSFRDCAQALDRWHEGGRRGERPPGRVRRHIRFRPSRTTLLWAEPIYRIVYDPDARPRALREAGEW
ncbi:MAG TPA: phospholipase D family protein [Candidatus Dormibacteraeota bacterium]|jgi:phosphatidylserine/phosphatidylglycerophosphate/cardiolipin synthase-like enzyme